MKKALVLDVVRLGVAAVLISGMGVSTVLTLVGAASWPLFLVLWSAAAVAGLIWVLRRRQPGGLAGRVTSALRNHTGVLRHRRLLP